MFSVLFATRRPRAFRFVMFRDEQSMRDAIEGMNGQSIGGRSITVNEAQSQGSGGGGGFRGGRRERGGSSYGRREGGYGDGRGYGGGGGDRYAGGGYDGGPRELGGSIDLLNYYKLERHHEFFCKRSLPSSISKTQYLQNVVGETEIRKGEGMELDQLFQNSTSVGCRHKPLHPFQLDVLMDAFQLREATSADLPYTKKRASDGSNLKGEGREEKKHKKHKHKNRESKKDKHKNIETKMGSNMQSHPRFDASRDKDKEYKRTGDHSFGSDHFLKQERVSKISTFLPL
nr:mediator of RNA polymerase II transcription subunit 19A isoform X1 [Ipomoea batatas]